MHRSLDEWGEDKSQLVVPQKYREEVTALIHRARCCVTLEARKPEVESCGISSGLG